MLRHNKSKKKKKKLLLYALGAGALILVLVLFFGGKIFPTTRGVTATFIASAKTVIQRGTVMIVPCKDKVDLSQASFPILMYHHIRDYNNPNDPIGNDLSISPAALAKQLDQIQEAGYHPTTFAKIASDEVCGKPIILTFDDGYADFYQNAFPELAKRNMTAVVYIITAKSESSAGYLTREQIRALDEAGIEIGAHSKTHPDLTKTGDTRTKEEIVDSKGYLDQLLRKPTVSFCYPSGKYSDAVANSVKDAGFKYAVTTKPGLANLASPFLLDRYRVNPDTNITNYLK